MRVPPGEVHVCSDSAAVAEALAEIFIDSAERAIRERGQYLVAFAGGTTPKAAYQLLATDGYRRRVEWRKVLVFFGDERCVPPQDPQSNYRMAREALLDPARVPTENVFRMRGEIAPEDAAREYARTLVEKAGEPPRVDLVMLGMGPDGHTASLFPGSDPRIDEERYVRAVYADSAKMWRITLTPAAINAARTVVFAVEGAAKAPMLASVLEGDFDPVRRPSQIVDPSPGGLIWLVDTAAAAELSAKAEPRPTA